MGTTVDKLNKVKDTKAAIKTAIEAKGVTVGDATFAQYPDKIAAISGGGTPQETYEEIFGRMQALLDAAIAKYPDYKAGNIFAFRNYPWIKSLYRWNNNSGNKAWEIGGTLYSYVSGDLVFDKPLSEFSDLGYTDCDGFDYKYVIVLFHNNVTIDSSWHCFYEFPMVALDSTKSSNNGNMNLFRFVACRNVPVTFGYVDTPDLIALDATGSIPNTSTSTGYGWRGVTLNYLKGVNFTGLTGRFDFTTACYVRNVSNLMQFQIQGYGYTIDTDSLIAILDALVDTTASPKSQGVGNSFNLRKLQATQGGLDAIARAAAKGWTITANTQ